jgi:hypothetical protein
MNMEETLASVVNNLKKKIEPLEFKIILVQRDEKAFGGSSIKPSLTVVVLHKEDNDFDISKLEGAIKPIGFKIMRFEREWIYIHDDPFCWLTNDDTSKVTAFKVTIVRNGELD